MLTYTGTITTLAKNEVFVFGSNLQGFHGAGAAGFASFGVAGNRWREFDYASKPNGWQGRWNIKGQSSGLQQGTSGWSFAIPTVTKPGSRFSVNRKTIVYYIERLYTLASRNPSYRFLVAYAGRGRNLNGYTPAAMAAMFAAPSGDIPDNVVFEVQFSELVKTSLATR